MNLDSQIERAVGSARVSARSIVTVCAAVLVLVWSTPPSNLYSQAEHEVTTLMELDAPRVLAEIAAERVPQVKVQVDMLRSILQEHGLSLRLGRGNWLDAYTDIIGYNAGAQSLWPLSVIEQAYRTSSTLGIRVRNVSAVESDLRQFLRSDRPSIPARVEEVWLSYDGSQLTLEWDASVAALRSVPSLPGVSLAEETYSVEFDLLDELSKRPDTAALVGLLPADRTANRLVLLPHAKLPELWTRVGDRPPAQARMYLAELANAPEKAIEILGVALPSRLLLIGFPLVLLSLSVHFSVYVTLILRLANGDVSGLAWIVALPSVGARALSAALLIALPALTWGVMTFAETSESLVVRVIFAIVGLVAVGLVGNNVLALGYPQVRSGLVRAVLDRAHRRPDSTA